VSHSDEARWAPGSFVIDCNVYLTSGYSATSDQYYNDLQKYKIGTQCGCTDIDAFNYDDIAIVDDNSCCFIAGCTDFNSLNYNSEACFDDESCIAINLGCTNPNAENFDSLANLDISFGGPLDSGVLGPGGFHYNDEWDMVFNCFEQVNLKSVDMYAETSFDVQIECIDDNGNQLYMNTVSLESGLNLVELNWQIPPGQNYRIGILGDNLGLYRNSSVPVGTFPINVLDIIEITSNTTDSPLAYFYYFYNWQLEMECGDIISDSCLDMSACNYLNSVVINDPVCLYPGDDCLLGIQEGGGFIYGIYNNECDCIYEDILLNESDKNRTPIKLIDILGRESINRFYFEMYEDGSVKKKIILK